MTPEEKQEEIDEDSLGLILIACGLALFNVLLAIYRVYTGQM